LLLIDGALLAAAGILGHGGEPVTSGRLDRES
jgi:hypothetical protein